MAKLTIYLPQPDAQALEQLALLEFRVPKTQAVVIISAELERQGLLDTLGDVQRKIKG